MRSNAVEKHLFLNQVVFCYIKSYKVLCKTCYVKYLLLCKGCCYVKFCLLCKREKMVLCKIGHSGCVAHLKFQLQYFVHHFHCLKIGIRYIRHSHSSMCTSQQLNEALAMKIIALWYMWYEHWIVAACNSLRRTNQF